MSFEDLLEANKKFADSFSLKGFDGIAKAGVAVVTCMDSRIDPLGMLGLKPGDAKIFRNPGGRITEAALEALVLGVYLLNVDRIVVIPHTKCAMTQQSEDQLHARISELAGTNVAWQRFHVIDDQRRALLADLEKVRSHPLIGDRAEVGGFIYDVDSGLINPV